MRTRNSGDACLKAQKTKSKSVARGRQTTRSYSVYSVLLILTRERDKSRSANAV